MITAPVHTFHIPVMGLAFSIDSPLKVARFGISSVLSLNDDVLIEQMRSYYCQLYHEPYTPIKTDQEDYRARRITAYLNLLDKLVKQQILVMQQESFTPETEITKYFELLPASSLLKQKYSLMQQTSEPEIRARMQKELRQIITPGRIDVNIMTKLDKTNHQKNGEPLPAIYSDALAGLRGFANSTVKAAVVFSAGMNMRLYSYLDQFACFYPDQQQQFEKTIIIKVSDFRSAAVQGKILAKKGIWVTEFRVESGLNCGGHAFATDGLLLGPILAEFKENRENLQNELFTLYTKALTEKGLPAPTAAPEQRLTVQGGIGTADEQEFLLRHYRINATGWGTPFLLVPEATTVDEATLTKLVQAGSDDLYLSLISPLGVPFNALRGTSSEEIKISRQERGQPGSPCTKKYLVSNTEFTETPICTASRKYQKLKLAQLQTLELPAADYQEQADRVLTKECLCDGLANSALQVLGLGRNPANRPVTVCPGPNLAFFSGIFSLQQMVDHIYGRINILNQTYRPHLFINELKMYVSYWYDLVKNQSAPISEKQQKSLRSFRDNLLKGIQYYQDLLPVMFPTERYLKTNMQQELNNAKKQLTDHPFKVKLAEENVLTCLV